MAYSLEQWEKTKAYFESGQYSLSQISEKTGIGKSQINRKSKIQQWVENNKNINEILLSDRRDGMVYIIFFEDSSNKRFYKIGIAKNLELRLKQHQTSSPFEIRIALSFYCYDVFLKEKELHNIYKNKRVRGEWFILSDKDLEEIKNGIVIDG